ncbi:MAG: hypothetical protein ABIG44_10205 [Planctomycetota bacterium]
MAGSSIIFRKSQLRLLARCCQQRVAARILLRQPGAPESGYDSHLVALRGRRLFITAPRDPFAWYIPDGAPVLVLFEYHGVFYNFSTNIRGICAPRSNSDNEQHLLQLSLPLSLEQRRPRCEVRATLAPDQRIAAHLTGVSDPDISLKVHLSDISSGGFGAILDANFADQSVPDDCYWAELHLPNNQQPASGFVRLAYQNQRATGWVFCGCDDPGLIGVCLEQVEDFIARQHSAAAVTDCAQLNTRS